MEAYRNEKLKRKGKVIKGGKRTILTSTRNRICKYQYWQVCKYFESLFRKLTTLVILDNCIFILLS